MSDPVALAIIGVVSSIVTSLANIVIAVLTRRKVGKLDRTLRSEGVAMRSAIAASCHHPADVSLRQNTGPRKDG